MSPLSGEDPLLGPLSQLQGDDLDGPEPDPEVDEQRFQPRSDDEDTCVASPHRHPQTHPSLPRLTSSGGCKRTSILHFSETSRTSLIAAG